MDKPLLKATSILVLVGIIIFTLVHILAIAGKGWDWLVGYWYNQYPEVLYFVGVAYFLLWIVYWRIRNELNKFKD